MKTGGTALIGFLREQFGEDRVVRPDDFESILYAANLLGEYDAATGHFDLHPSFNWPTGIYFLTVIRDPVERFLSHYSYLREGRPSSEPFAILAREHDLASLLRLEDEAVLSMARDYYTRHYAGAFLQGEALVTALPGDELAPAKLFQQMTARYT